MKYCPLTISLLSLLKINSDVDFVVNMKNLRITLDFNEKRRLGDPTTMLRIDPYNHITFKKSLTESDVNDESDMDLDEKISNNNTSVTSLISNSNSNDSELRFRLEDYPELILISGPRTQSDKLPTGRSYANQQISVNFNKKIKELFQNNFQFISSINWIISQSSVPTDIERINLLFQATIQCMQETGIMNNLKKYIVQCFSNEGLHEIISSNIILRCAEIKNGASALGNIKILKLINLSINESSYGPGQSKEIELLFGILDNMVLLEELAISFQQSESNFHGSTAIHRKYLTFKSNLSKLELIINYNPEPWIDNMNKRLTYQSYWNAFMKLISIKCGMLKELKTAFVSNNAVMLRTRGMKDCREVENPDMYRPVQFTVPAFQSLNHLSISHLHFVMLNDIMKIIEGNKNLKKISLFNVTVTNKYKTLIVSDGELTICDDEFQSDEDDVKRFGKKTTIALAMKRDVEAKLISLNTNLQELEIIVLRKAKRYSSSDIVHMTEYDVENWVTGNNIHVCIKVIFIFGDSVETNGITL
jgi:hypothetical protein